MFGWFLNTPPNTRTIFFLDVGAFLHVFFFCKIHKKTHVPDSLFNKIIGVYPATSLKERTPIQVFSDEFCEILKITSLQSTSRRLLLFCEKIFFPLNGKEKMGAAFEKNKDTRKART